MAYTESAGVTQAKKKLDLLTGPESYRSDWAAPRDQVLAQLQNRPEFSYDPQEDALYHQYARQYVRLGRRAMEDTMGKAAGLTGGYGSSYAETAAQQTYQDYLTGLNDLVPQLYQQALDRYTREGDALRQQYDLLSGREKSDYDRYRDSLEDYLHERDYLAGRYDAEYNADFNRWTDERDYNYKVQRDQIADSHWQAEYNLKAAAAAGGGSSGSSGKRSSGGGSSSGSSGSSSSSGAPSLVSVLQYVRKSGDSAAVKNQKISAAIREALNRGEIDVAQANKYLAAYRV